MRTFPAVAESKPVVVRWVPQFSFRNYSSQHTTNHHGPIAYLHELLLGPSAAVHNRLLSTFGEKLDSREAADVIARCDRLVVRLIGVHLRNDTF